jgi:hypothetical protein
LDEDDEVELNKENKENNEDKISEKSNEEELN